jgi:hypothetical protein
VLSELVIAQQLKKQQQPYNTSNNNFIVNTHYHFIYSNTIYLPWLFTLAVYDRFPCCHGIQVILIPMDTQHCSSAVAYITPSLKFAA